jgi:hypothetical protein
VAAVTAVAAVAAAATRNGVCGGGEQREPQAECNASIIEVSGHCPQPSPSHRVSVSVSVSGAHARAHAH